MSEKRNWNPMLFLARTFAKYLPNNDVVITLVASMFCVLILFVVFYIIHPEKYLLNLGICGGLYLFIVPYMLISESQGRKRHRTALDGIKLKPLQELGFEIENIEEYWGYSGVIEGYYLKIYYDWNERLAGSKSNGSLCIMVYFSSPKTKTGRADVRLMKELHEKYQTGIFSANDYKVNFQANYFQLFVPFTFLTDYEDIKARIDFAIALAQKEKLEPISENEVKSMIQKTPWQYGPTVTTFTKIWMEKLK